MLQPDRHSPVSFGLVVATPDGAIAPEAGKQGENAELVALRRPAIAQHGWCNREDLPAQSSGEVLVLMTSVDHLGKRGEAHVRPLLSCGRFEVGIVLAHPCGHPVAGEHKVQLAVLPGGAVRDGRVALRVVVLGCHVHRDPVAFLRDQVCSGGVLIQEPLRIPYLSEQVEPVQLVPCGHVPQAVATQALNCLRTIERRARVGGVLVVFVVRRVGDEMSALRRVRVVRLQRLEHGLDVSGLDPVIGVHERYVSSARGFFD